ncbi:YjcQ family protein [Guptibacillus hwajinpoensis]|uniref:YjcQ family protein n=1 Tax=Guptibacillus hwajinpoensis TaxID=208199 RepID=UPI003CFDA8AE
MEKLELLCKFLKAVANEEHITANDLGIELEKFADVYEMAKKNGLISAPKVVRGGQGNKAIMVMSKDAKITFDGLHYLDKNCK